MESLGKRLRSARERKKLKQTEVKVRTGINNKTLSGYENGVSEPDAETLRILANLYDVTTDYLLGSDNENKKSYNDKETTIRLIKEEADRLGMVVDDPRFQKLLSDAFDMLRIARGKDDV